MRTTNLSLVLAVAALLAACGPQGEKLLERAEASMAQGEYRAAMIDLKNYVAKHPDDAGARARLGLALLELGDLAGAQAEVAKAHGLGADRLATLEADCRLMVAAAEYQRVLDECTATGDAAVDPALAIARGNALLALERFGEAKAEFQSASQAQAMSLAVIDGLAAATLRTDGAVAARDVFDQAPEELKEQGRYWLALGSAELRGGDYGAAERAFADAVARTKDQDESRDHLMALAGLTESQMRQGKSAEASATSEALLKAAPRNPLAKLLAAQAALGAGDLAKSRTLLEEMVSKDPENAEVRTMLGMVNLQQGNLGQAEMHLATVVSRNPDNVRAQQLLAAVRSQLGSPEQSLEALKPALERPTTDPSLYALAGQLSLQGGDREQAIQYLDLAQKGSSSSENQLELAAAYLAAGEIGRAIEILEAMPELAGDAATQRETLLVSALLRQGKQQEVMARADSLAARSPEDVTAHTLAGAVYAAVGRNDRARSEWNRVLEVRPGDVSVRINLARLDIAEGKPDAAEAQLNRILADDPKNLQAMLGLAAVAESSGDMDGAERRLKQAVAEHPDSPQAQLVKAQYYLSRRDFGEARAAAAEATRLSPRNGVAFNLRGLAELGAGDPRAAVDSFKQAVEAAPRGNFQLNLARAYVAEGKPDQALRVLDDSLRLMPGQPTIVAAAGAVALKAGMTERASGYVARLRALAPEAPGTFRLEGDLAMAQKRYKDALRHYEATARLANDGTLAIARSRAGVAAGMPRPQAPLEEWLAKSPDDAEVRVVLAEYEQWAGNHSAAIAAYELALQASPGNVVALNNLAGLYQQKGDSRALSTAERAYDAAPRNPAVKDTYGWALVGSGQVDRGLVLIREAAEALPGVPEVKYHLGAALARKGDEAEARRILDEVLADPESPAAVRADAETERAKLGR